ncbi:reticulon-like protein B9 [Canna indica]|uniref:Reticulon-like protein n=1 Tax=Canna indica TaxID=4628 RepID=A0AAQ3K8I2_9LILI|nr:reticulon-like protein B9 [Canna indica]
MPLHSSSSQKLFGRQRPLHELFGQGKVANIILWRDKRLSSSILISVSLVWLLFEVMEYNFVSLLCHISILVMLLVFIWSNGAELLKQPSPKIPELMLSEETFTRAALLVHEKIGQFLSILHQIACGKDLKLFLSTVVSLWIISVVGSWFSTINLLFFVLSCGLTLPALYERYEDEVDYLVMKGSVDAKEWYNKFDSQFLGKIPRGGPAATKTKKP